MNVCNEIFRHDPESVALIGIDDGTPQYITYGEMDKVTNRVANALQAAGFSSGRRIVVQGYNSPQAVMLWIAAVKCGGSAVFIPVSAPPKFAARIVEDSGASLHLSGDAISEFITAAGVLDAEFETIDVDPAATCEITLTSGTSGADLQSLIEHSHEQTMFSIRAGAEAIGAPKPGDVVFGSASLPFAYAMGAQLLAPLMYGAATIMCKPLSLLGALSTIKQLGVTQFFSGPAFYRAACAHVSREACSAVRIWGTAGEYLPPSLRDKWESASGGYLTNIYGAAEGQYILARSIEEDVADGRMGRMGRIVSPYTMRVVDGELEVTGMYNTFILHDAVEVVGDALYIHGRTDDVITTSEGKFNPAVVEGVAMDSGALLDVFAVPYKRSGVSMVQLYGIRNPRNSEDDAELRSVVLDWCKSRLPKTAAPVTLTFVDALPRTSTGKAQRKFVIQGEK